MSDERERPGVRFWVIVALVVVLAGYPLSFGPACWITSRLLAPHPIFDALYAPLWRAARMIGGPSWEILDQFGCLGMARGSTLMINLGDDQGDDWAVILHGPRL